MSLIKCESLNEFFYEQIEKHGKFLSPTARFYVSELLSNLGNPQKLISHALEEYTEKSLTLMLKDAVEAEDRFKSFYLHRKLGDLCLVLGGIYKIPNVSDDLIIYLGEEGYRGASLYYPWKGFLSVYPELCEKFSMTMEALRKLEIKI